MDLGARFPFKTASLSLNRLPFFFFLTCTHDFIYVWLHCVCVATCRLSLIVVHGRFIAVASLVAEHRLQEHRRQQVQLPGSVAAAC